MFPESPKIILSCPHFLKWFFQPFLVSLSNIYIIAPVLFSGIFFFFFFVGADFTLVIFSFPDLRSGFRANKQA